MASIYLVSPCENKTMLPFVSRLPASEQDAWIQVLAAKMPDENIVPFTDLTPEEKQSCELAIVSDPDPQNLLTLPRLKWVQSMWAGVDRMLNDIPSCPFSIVRMIDPELADTMAEAVLSWSLYLHRDMPEYAKQQRKQVWLPQPMVHARDRRVGILGLGELGQRSAQRLLDNGFKVLGWSRRQKTVDGVECLSGEEGLASLLKSSDILVCLLPLTSQTQGLLDATKLGYLPTGAKLINFARGGIIDDNALLACLDNGSLSHAVLDVFVQEPLPEGHDYWHHESVTVLPHISAPTSMDSACEIAANNIKQYRLTGNIPAAVNPANGY